MLHFLKFKKKKKIDKKQKYSFSVTPLLSGQYTGSITFIENDGSYIWYTVLVNTDSPLPDRVLDLNSFIRQAAAFEIDLNNPLNQPVNFEVIINGEGLIGENNFFVQPKSTSTY